MFYLNHLLLATHDEGKADVETGDKKYSAHFKQKKSGFFVFKFEVSFDELPSCVVWLSRSAVKRISTFGNQVAAKVMDW